MDTGNIVSNMVLSYRAPIPTKIAREIRSEILSETRSAILILILRGILTSYKQDQRIAEFILSNTLRYIVESRMARIPIPI